VKHGYSFIDSLFIAIIRPSNLPVNRPGGVRIIARIFCKQKAFFKSGAVVKVSSRAVLPANDDGHC
jgi:hypothetical protein